MHPTGGAPLSARSTSKLADTNRDDEQGKSFMKNLLATAAALAIASAATPANAAVNLISNGGFESNGGAFSNTIDNWDTGFDGWFASPLYFGNTVYEGSFFASTGCVSHYCSLSQSFATISGASYNLSFAFNPGPLAEPDQGNTLVQIDGNTLVDIIGGAQGWSVYNASFTATGPSTTLTFSGFQNPAWNGVDDVSVFAAAVPEPATWALMIVGFGIVGGSLRRQRKQSVRVTYA